MSVSQASVVFVDNLVNRVFKTVEALKPAFPKIQIFKNESEFLEALTNESFDIIFLNLDLQPNDAVTVLKEIKSKKIESKPLLIIYSDKQDDFVQELAFNSGADSFINFHNKPSVMELFLKNILRRRISVVKNTQRSIIIDNDKYMIFRNGEGIQLPRKEFKLFELLYHSSEKFFTKTEIAKSIWNDETVANKRTIDVHIYNIRQFFGKRIIQSQKGKGYRMNKKIIA
jgi:DNA-binding response OmpR family regulator